MHIKISNTFLINMLLDVLTRYQGIPFSMITKWVVAPRSVLTGCYYLEYTEYLAGNVVIAINNGSRQFPAYHWCRNHKQDANRCTFSFVLCWFRRRVQQCPILLTIMNFKTHCAVWLCMSWSYTLKRKCRHFDEILITGCTGSCYFDNFKCSQWWQFHQNEDISLSV